MADTPDSGGTKDKAAAAADKAKRSAEKPTRSHGERAMASLRTASRVQGDVTDPLQLSQIALAEANVLALLELADALGGSTGRTKGGK